MSHFFIILLKINLVLILFAAAYYLILRRLTFYTINRIFLVFGILFSSIYPFINLTDFFHRQKQINQGVVAFVPELNQKVNTWIPSNFITAHWQLISIIFYVGVTLMALRLMVQFVSLYQMHRKSAPGAIADYKVRILAETVGPFSFWQTVYINPSLHQEKELHTILAHEQVHVKQWHSLDIILAELSVVFYWFNPGVWLMKKAVKENLEFITDQKILNKGIDKKTYQYSLLDVGNLTPAVAIVNNFSLADLKKRIKMMNVKRSSRLTLSRYLLVTPILLFTTLAFTVSKKDIRKHLMPLHQVLVNTHLIEPEATSQKTLNNKAQTKTAKKKQIAGVKKVDSTNKIKVLFRTLFIDTATGPNPTDLPEFPVHIRLKGTVAGEKMSTAKEQFLRYKITDTIGSGSGGEGRRIKNIQFQLKNGEQIPAGTSENAKVIFVSSQARMSKPLDSVIANGDVTIFVNGRKISPEDFKKFKASDIKNVNIKKDTSLPSIHIETKQ